ncbi:37096_t:CDS:2 [Racocetra persica]|uniref:37096_t:CDS:1 n=1 Tax=Racocetra persica TaxID=160502 RepID=A0ACA9L2W0_9GLOM|nr:37096_t:CDS:2 [Racocetra persica]
MLSDDLPVTTKELYGWYLYNLACEVYYVAAITVFIPVVLEHLASQAGFELDHVTPCNMSQINYKCQAKFGTVFVDTASYSLYIISISVFLQAIVYIAFGSLADHGNYRKKFLLTFSYIGALATIAFIFVISSDLYWFAGLLTIISNVSFGAAFVFYLAYIPTFTRAHPRVIDAKRAGISPDELNKIEEKIANTISSNSVIVGCSAGVLILILCAGVVLLMKDDAYSYQVSTAICGAWWLLNLTFPLLWLQDPSLHALIPIYGLIGFVAPFGLKNVWEVWMFAVYFGFSLGAIQSYCRVLFGSIVPRGHENELFSLYEITDKGSSWLGPFVVALIEDVTHDLRYSYFFLFVMMIVPIFIIYTVDVQRGKEDAETFVRKEYEILELKRLSAAPKDIIT